MITKRKAYLSEISKVIGKRYVGKDCVIDGLGWANIMSEHESLLSFASSEKYLKQAVRNPKINALIVNEDLLKLYRDNDYREIAFFVTEQPMATFYQLHNLLYERTDFYKSKVDQIRGSNCNIHKNAFIDDGVIIGDNVTVGPYTSVLYGTIISNNVHIESNCLIGEAGFQVVNVDGKLQPVHHVGGVTIEEGVRIKSFCTIDKDLFEGNTHVGAYTYIDTHVCISHGTHMGKNCLIGRASNICGNVNLGNQVWIAPSVTVGFRVKIGHNARINIGSVVVANVHDGQEISGYYGMPHQSWMMKYKHDLKHYVFQSDKD